MSTEESHDFLEGIDIEAVLNVLGTLADNCDVTSDEHRAIELAAKALCFAYNKHARSSFKAFLINFNGPLTDKQREHLKQMGAYDDDDERDQ